MQITPITPVPNGKYQYIAVDIFFSNNIFAFPDGSGKYLPKFFDVVIGCYRADSHKEIPDMVIETLVNSGMELKIAKRVASMCDIYKIEG